MSLCFSNFLQFFLFKLGTCDHSYLWFHFLISVLFLFWQGMYGIENEVFLSLPCILNARGLTSVISQKLKDDEVAQLKKSADTLWDIQKELKDL